ncbi:hypothetical protein GB931_15570 [Modestobacter sp. I12A-02628]|uniref:Uncharacterized protein n=1 Tax=Goekera deserti TaxID=2497753 RepID=A0A7K3WL43_9ACTN|nr:hypothetical protein [Goekera deserti]MPQ99309.1 hypothetical protein [Goekera deserti]NDI50308.1 hypothetical protein [Goekera deserti]NEL56440.1 hypothetical protein [Goekera deserti]
MDRGPGTTAALAVAGGAVFGATTSLVNALSSPYGQLALTDGPLRRLAVVASLLLDAGWAWAALAVAGGWLAGGVRRGALTGSLALLGAVPAYYVTDAAGRGEELSG